MNFFILGSHPELSAAEIKAVTGKSGTRYGEVLVVDDVDTSLPNLQNRLAGTIKIGSIVGSLKTWNKDEAADLVRSMITERDGKVHFGISIYGQNLSRNAEPLGLEVKKKLKEDGISCRLVTSKEATLSSVVVQKNHLLQSGGEFVVIQGHGEILIGQTETIQDFEAWSERDFGRPARDAKSGMLPPKLARMMINLSGVDPAKALLLDPFCGSGTIPMEASLMGFHEVVGADISEKAVKDSAKNLRWALPDTAVPQIMLSPAEDLKLDGHVDVVVTEPYLGPPQRGGEEKMQIDNLRTELTSLYIKSFANIHRLMKPKAKLVVAFPLFNKLSAMTKPLPGFHLEERFVYEREGQRVGREILVYTRE
ncbi:MAG: 50S ribosomal protein L11 methyltransferase [Patescibacteria group bacterium]